MKLVVVVLSFCALAFVSSLAVHTLYTSADINTQHSIPVASELGHAMSLPPITKAQAFVSPAVEESPLNYNFSTPVTYVQGDSRTYVNGLVVTLQSITDSRCIKDTKCITTGELSPQFTQSDSNLPDESTIMMGSIRTRSLATPQYEYILVNASETEATIIITPVIVEKATTTTAKVFPKPTAKPTLALEAPQTKVVPVSPKMPTKALSATKTKYTTDEFTQTLVQEIAKLTNEFRIKSKRQALATDNDLADNATNYSQHLLTNNFLSHTDKRGCDISCRFLNNSYLAQAWGENLAMLSFDDRPSVEYVANLFMTQWKKSASHRENLLSSAFTHQGIGVTFDQNKIYMVVHFAYPQ